VRDRWFRRSRAACIYFIAGGREPMRGNRRHFPHAPEWDRARRVVSKWNAQCAKTATLNRGTLVSAVTYAVPPHCYIGFTPGEIRESGFRKAENFLGGPPSPPSAAALGGKEQ